MKLLHDNISPLIESQFPAFYNEEGDMFITFVREYYKWLEASGNPLYHSRHILEYRDIDDTLDEFLPNFQTKYMVGTPTNTIQNQRDLIKHSRDIYQTKGTIESLRLIFQMLYGAEIQVYYPGDDILRTSDGVWVTPRYLELSVSDRTVEFIGKIIQGSISGAKAFIESVDRRTFQGRTVDVAYISNIEVNRTTGQGFLYGELISDNGVIANAPKVVGSLSRVGITSAGAGYETGEIVDVISTRNGVEGKARVTGIGNRTGEVNYLLVDGGYGYTTSANVVVSSNVLSIISYRSTNPYNTHFPEFSTVIQPLANVTFSTANATFAVGDLVYGVNSTSGVISAGFVLAANQATSTGWLLISPHSVSKLTIDTVTFPYTNTGSFILGESVYQVSGEGNSAVGVIVTANATHATVDQYIGPFANNKPMYGATSGAQANVATVTTYAYTNTNFSNSSISNIIIANTTSGAYRTGATDLTATANVVGANATAVGVIGITNAFVGGPKSWIYNANDYATAEITVTSSGNPGGFKIGAIENAETIIIDTDTIGGTNGSNTAYLNLAINAATYGFPANTSANSSSVIGTTWTKRAFTIGSIATLTQRYPGFNNTAKPFVVEIEKAIAAYGKHSHIACGLANTVGQFREGEVVTQTVQLPKITLGVANVSGTFTQNVRELVKQVRSDGVTVYGELYLTSVVANTGSLSLYVANTSNTFNTSNTIVGLSSSTTATVTSVASGFANSVARGVTLNSTLSSVTLKRTSFQDFVVGGTMFGSETGATATLAVLQEDTSSPVLGNDAYVDPLAGIADGTISTVEIIDSGVFYENGEVVELRVEGNQTPAYGVAYIETNGLAEGYWEGDRGTLDSSKRIQDNEYYQEYSYEIQSGVDRATYESSIKALTHVAGTKMFSKYVNSTTAASVPTKTVADYDRVTTLTLTSVSGAFVAGDTVTQSNGSSTTATGVVLSYNSTLNTLQVVSTTGRFVTSNTVTSQSNSSVHGSTTGINITLL